MIRQRILTALVLAVALVSAIFYMPPAALAVVLGLLFVGGAWEWAGFFGYPRGVRRVPLVIAVAAALLLTYWWVALRGGSGLPILLVAALWWVIALIWVALYPTRIPAWSIIAAAFAMLVPAWLAAWQLLVSPDFGGPWLLFVFVLVWAADSGAYFSGKSFGRHKLAPRVSPGKTWEGFIGGLVFALLVSAAAAHWFGVAMWPFLGICALATVTSVVGDLTVSLFKRGAGLKDSGRIFPGHGGILDRIDSLCAAAPVLLLGLLLGGVSG